jgi:hypothetical protein
MFFFKDMGLDSWMEIFGVKEKRSKKTWVGLRIFCKCHLVRGRSKELTGVGAMTAMEVLLVDDTNHICSLFFYEERGYNYSSFIGCPSFLGF